MVTHLSSLRLEDTGLSAPVARPMASAAAIASRGRSSVLKANIPPSALCEVADATLLLHDAGRSDASLSQEGAAAVSTGSAPRFFGRTTGFDDADSLLGEDDRQPQRKTPRAPHEDWPVFEPAGGEADIDTADAGDNAALVTSVLEGLETLKANFLARLLRCCMRSSAVCMACVCVHAVHMSPSRPSADSKQVNDRALRYALLT